MELTNESEHLKRVVITGARGALGMKVAEHFIDAGCTVVGLDLVVKGEDVHADPNIHRLHWSHCDVTDSGTVSRVFTNITEKFGAIDGLVHCAGGFRFAHADAIGDDDVEFLLNANLKSSILVVREALRHMKTKNFGRIVLVSSASTLHPGSGVSAYSASKAGINALVQSVADEVRGGNININAVLPSVIDTQANRSDMPNADFAKWVSPSSLADIVFMLTQPVMDPVRGALIPVTAGS